MRSMHISIVVSGVDLVGGMVFNTKWAWLVVNMLCTMVQTLNTQLAVIICNKPSVGMYNNNEINKFIYANVIMYTPL